MLCNVIVRVRRVHTSLYGLYLIPIRLIRRLYNFTRLIYFSLEQVHVT